MYWTEQDCRPQPAGVLIQTLIILRVYVDVVSVVSNFDLVNELFGIGILIGIL